MTTDTLTRADPKISRRPFASLGHANHGWLDARHHFSFSSYHDPDRTGWGSIRVWNDDVIAANSGFPAHTRIATWKSSPMSARARSAIRIRWATAAAPARATCR